MSPVHDDTHVDTYVDANRRLSDAQQSDNLRTFMGAAARHSGGTVTDRMHLRITRDIAEGFAAHSGQGGATKTQVWEWITQHASPTYSVEAFESRWEVFESERLIRPHRSKKHQQRHSFHPLGTVFLMICDRLESRGGIDELIGLLDRTQELLDRDHPDREAVAHNIVFCQWVFQTFAVQLAALVVDGSLQELMEDQWQYRHQDLDQRILRLNHEVNRHFPKDVDLAHKAIAMVEAEQRYAHWAAQAVLRVLDRAGTTLDFDVLSAEEYLDAARNAPPEQLAEAGLALVADAPQVWLDAGAVVDALEAFMPRHRVRYRPPLPEGSPDRDPFGAVAERAVRERARRERAADRMLLEQDRAEMTEELRRSRWPRAVRLLTDLILLDADPHAPYRVEMGTELIIDREAWVTHLHPVTVHRTNTPAVLPPPVPVATEQGDEEP
ncbi:hypothetical protein Sipo8835_23225 [Streptomyces ipomoeae]|uniref:Uncharacterized protein n=1 Tax=Streptomyces ipomoeae TaxID=103232 RepID=A0AAE9AZU3_9ACTN|nr:hypothetical protein [Streptomyces ipomoeae]TQE30418.1 hypothetical protein Sipo8835_23225 [Streptomyces ipomoeae]